MTTVVAAGSGGANAGTITVDATTATTTQDSIIIGDNLSSKCQSTTPAEKVAAIVGISSGVSAGNDTLFRIRVDNLKNGVFQKILALATRQALEFVTLVIPLIIPEKCDFKITVATVGGTADATAGFSYYLIDKREFQG